jgi:23S rRNA pseudouridine2457 synthase
MNNFKYIIFNKPYGVLCQFSGEDKDKTLSDFGLPKEVYPAGRLDKDSEGLLLLTNDGAFNQKLTHPKNEKSKIYHVQVENIPSEDALKKLRDGRIKIKDYLTAPAKVKLIETNYCERTPPIRVRKNIPDSWLEIEISEGKNRQVRRMTAAIGHPTLRLIRVKIGKYKNINIEPGAWIQVKKEDIL